MATKVAINGFGRIGRNILRAAKKYKANFDFVAVNDITDNKTLAHLLKYDSVHGKYPGTVEATGEGLLVDGDKLRVTAEKDPGAVAGDKNGVEIALETTED